MALKLIGAAGSVTAGFILTTAVALLIAAYLEPPRTAAPPTHWTWKGGGYRMATRSGRDAFGEVWVVEWERDKDQPARPVSAPGIPAWTLVREPPEEIVRSGSGNVIVTALATGFPLPCLAAQCHRLTFEVSSSRGVPLEGVAIDRDWPWGNGWLFTNPRRLPVRPIWSRLLINIAFWSLVVAGAAFGPKLVRRSWRRHRRQCVKCGYQLVPVGTCPECGLGRGSR